MILQHRTDGTLRVFTQHDHGLCCGELAHAWRGAGAPLSLALALVVAMHDVAWTELDDLANITPDALPFDDEAGLPRDFQTLGLTDKIALYGEGIDLLERMHPYAGLLMSFHYAFFIPAERAPEFTAHEQRRRARLADALGLDAPDAPAVLEDFARLKFFDLISLYSCLAAPGAVDARRPFWIRDELKLGEETFALGWRGEDVLTMAPFCFDAPVEAPIAYRDLPTQTFEDAAAFLAAWRGAPAQTWALRVARA